MSVFLFTVENLRNCEILRKSDTDESYSTFNLTEVACAAYGHNPTTTEKVNCWDVDSQAKCQNIATFASQLANETVSGNFVEKTSEYKSYCELE